MVFLYKIEGRFHLSINSIQADRTWHKSLILITKILNRLMLSLLKVKKLLKNQAYQFLQIIKVLSLAQVTLKMHFHWDLRRNIRYTCLFLKLLEYGKYWRTMVRSLNTLNKLSLTYLCYMFQVGINIC